jgi:hypothetical protein
MRALEGAMLRVTPTVALVGILAIPVLFAFEYAGYSLSRHAGDAAVFLIYPCAIAIGWVCSQVTSSRIVAGVMSALFCLLVVAANGAFLRWLRIDLLGQMDDQVFGWFVPVYIGLLAIPSLAIGVVMAAWRVRP